MKEDRLLWIAISIGTFLVGAVGLFIVRLFIAKIPSSQTHRLRTFHLHLGEYFFATILAFGVTFFISEVGLISEFFKRQMTRTFSELTIDANYLRKNFKDNKILEFRTATVEALCKLPIERGPGSFSDLLENTIYPMLDNVKRESYEIDLSYETAQIAGRKVVRVIQTGRWIYRNPSRQPVIVPLNIFNALEPISGVDPKGLFKIQTLKIDGKEKRVDVSMEKSLDGILVFRSQNQVEVNQEASVEVTLKKTLPFTRNNYIAIWMPTPTKGLTLSFKHPTGLQPYFYVFGIGALDPFPLEEKPGFHKWRFTGWLLTRHGAIVSWSEKF